jgi:hypothetical protein
MKFALTFFSGVRQAGHGEILETWEEEANLLLDGTSKVREGIVLRSRDTAQGIYGNPAGFGRE